jgi:secreted trypsin-like serine protease
MHFTRRSRLAALAVALAAPLAATALPAHAVVGTPAAAGDYTFTARLDIGDGTRACSGALVAPQWIVTAASCFADDPATSLAVPAGKPALHTTATIGRTDLTTTAGAVRDVVQLVPRADRDLVLARLAKPVNTVTPVAVATTAPAAGEELTVSGYGRTTDEWAPVQMHTGTFTVDAAPAGTDVNLTGKDGAAVCKGDTGGPALRVTNGTPALVAVNSRSWQSGCWGVSETQTGAVDTRTDDLAGWIDDTVSAAPVTDFNCDGQRDIAISDPGATVGTDTGAGLVRVSYGGGKGTAEITEDLATVPGGAEPDDRFGETLAVVDYDTDGCSDLVVGSWHENLDGVADAGRVSVVYGSPDGLAKGRNGTSFREGAGTGALGTGTAEAGDHFGAALAAGTTTDGDPYIVVGAPREDYKGVTDAGVAYYLRDGDSVLLSQATPGYGGDLEQGDRFGATVAASPEHLTIGSPTESVGTHDNSGTVQVLSQDLNADGVPTPLASFGQGADFVSGNPEAGDQFGNALAMVPYRPAGSPSATDSLLAIGVPDEQVGADKPDAGRVVIMHITANGDITELRGFGQDANGVGGGAETGDRFGARLAAVNTRPGHVSTAQTLLLAVGIPGENLSGVADAGAVQVFSLLGAPGDSDVWLNAGSHGIPGSPGAGEKMGDRIHATDAGLYLGMPNGPAAHGSLYDVPWANVTDGAGDPVTTYRPGSGGFPSAGSSFGFAAR